MKIKEYRKLSESELMKELNKLKMELMKSGVGFIQARVGKKKEKGPSGSDIAKRIRKEIARINHCLNEKYSSNEMLPTNKPYN